MINSLTGLLKGLPKEAITVIIASLPIAELRGAIPFGLAMNISPLKTYYLAVAGNLIPVIPVLFLLTPVTNRLRRVFFLRKFFDWFFERTKKKAEIVQRYEAIGLILFVAIPLPVTGAWTGCVAASLFKIKHRYAIPAICVGILLAGIVVLAACLLGRGVFGALM